MSKAKRQLLKHRYHQAVWQEPLMYELGSPGERGILPPVLEKEIREAVGDVVSLVPPGMIRKEPPRLPEVGQPQVVRHYIRLSQETSGYDTSNDIARGTSTMKYSPKINERLANVPEILDLHPLQDESTVQGILEIIYKLGECLKEISGMDAFTCQPPSGSWGVFTNARMLRAYQEERGLGLDKKDEIITTIFSHPCCHAVSAVAGYKLVTLYPDETGFPNLTNLKAAVSERTAGMILGCPDDNGIYNPHVEAFCDTVHAVGGLCVLDQANANGVLGVCRAREAGFDMVHFNLHKTFSSPHGMAGPGSGPAGCTKELEKYLPVPMVAFDGKRYFLDYNRPHSIGKVSSFYGNVQVVLRAYCWIMSLGADGLRTVAETAVLNNKYLSKRLLSEVRGLAMGYPQNDKRLHEIRYSWERLKNETGVDTWSLFRRMADYGIGGYFASHEPWVVPEPMTPEPTETFSKDDIDEFAEIVKQVAEEAYSDPHFVKAAPHKRAVHLTDDDRLHHFTQLATTARAWYRKHRQSRGEKR